MLLALDQIDHNPTPLRGGDPTKVEPDFVASIANQGVLQPILVRQDGNRYVVVKGDRRLAAARAAGHSAIPVLVENAARGPHALAANAAATLARKPLRMTEQFRALARLQDEGLPADQAAMALGMDPDHARKLERLGRLHPDLLAELARDEVENPEQLPDWRTLGIIAAASPDAQMEAARACGFPDDFYWDDISGALRMQRRAIPRDWAIFPHDQVHWQEDFFAQPDSPSRFTAAEPAAFLAAQQAALAALASKSKGRLEVVEPASAIGKLLTAGHLYSTRGWRIDAYGNDLPTKLEKGDGRTVYALVQPDGHQTGRVRWAIAVEQLGGADPAPPAAPAFQAPTAHDPDLEDPQDEYEDDGDPGDTGHPAAAKEPEPELPLTKHGQALLADARTQALRAALRDPATRYSTDDLLALLLVALSAKTVTVKTSHHTYASSADMRDLAAKLLSPEGTLRHDEPGLNLEHLAREALARMLSFPKPEDQRHGYAYESDPIATAIARITEADTHLPRLDTEAFLATVSGAELKAYAKAQGLKLSKVSAIREALAGTAPDFRPAWALLAREGGE